MELISMPSCTISHNGLGKHSADMFDNLQSDSPHLTEPMDSPHYVFHNKINFGLSSETADAESQGRMCHILGRTLRGKKDVKQPK